MRLDPAVASSGVALIAREEVGSTNSEAMALARGGQRGPLWITARGQSAGRGRRGRVWVSEPGNLYASLLLTDPAPPERAAELSFVAALAVFDAVAALAPDITSGLALKWPNDLLFEGKKLAGILIEGEGAAVVVGIGVNCAHHPKEAAFPAIDLAAAGVLVTVEGLFETLSAAMERRLAQWNRSVGFHSIRTDWLERAAGLGGPLRVSLPEGEHAGQFETIDARGRLVLRRPDGAAEMITAGEVFALSATRPRRAAAER